MPFAAAPSRRFAYHLDGTVAVFHNQNNKNDGQVESEWGDEYEREFNYPTGQTNAYEYRNSEEDRTIEASQNFEDDHAGRWYTWLWPEFREVDGVFGVVTSQAFTPAIEEVEYSTDATSAHSGSWTTAVADLAQSATVFANYRDNITSTAINQCIALRVFVNAAAGQRTGLDQFHIYGFISPGYTPDRLIYLNADSGDTPFTQVLDLGEHPQGMTVQQNFKILNNSAQYTLNDIDISAEALYRNAATWVTFSLNDISYATTQNLGNLGPGNSKIVYTRISVPDTETTGTHTGYIRLDHVEFV